MDSSQQDGYGLGKTTAYATSRPCWCCVPELTCKMGGMIAEAALQPSNPNAKAQMSNEGILPILDSIGIHPPFDIWILSFDIVVETITKKYVTYVIGRNTGSGFKTFNRARGEVLKPLLSTRKDIN